MNIKMRFLPFILATVLLCSCGSSTEVSSQADTGGNQEVAAQPVSEAPAANTAEVVTETTSNDAAITNKITIEDNIDLSYVKDTSAAGLFKDFLSGNATAAFNGDNVSLGNLIATNIDLEEYGSEGQTMTEYLSDQCAISYAVSEASEPTLYLEIMNVMVEGAIYQIRINDGGLYVNSNLDTGWSDSLSVYPNGMLAVYHGMSLPTVEYFYDGTDKMLDIISGEGKAKLLIFGPKSYFETDFEQAKSDYEAMADTVLAYEDDPFAEFASERDDVVKMSADNDLIEWKQIKVTSFEE